MALLLVVILEESRRRHHHPSTTGSRPREKNLEPAQNAKSDPIWWSIYMQEWCDYQSNNPFYLQTLPVGSSRDNLLSQG